jgi:hypothetical protein
METLLDEEAAAEVVYHVRRRVKLQAALRQLAAELAEAEAELADTPA